LPLQTQRLSAAPQDSAAEHSQGGLRLFEGNDVIASEATVTTRE
jgi:hypothetical protein